MTVVENWSGLPPELTRDKLWVSWPPDRSVAWSDEGWIDAEGGTRPVPVSGTVASGRSGSLLKRERVAWKSPAWGGAKVMFKEAEARGARVKDVADGVKTRESVAIDWTWRTSVPAFSRV